MAQENKPATGERRKFIRYACRTELKSIIDFNPDVARRTLEKLPPIVFRRGESGTIRDISEKGISVELEHFLPEGMIVKMAIDNPATPSIETDARVVWSKKLSGGKREYVMGMTFRHMKNKHQRNLEKLIAFLRNIPE